MNSIFQVLTLAWTLQGGQYTALANDSMFIAPVSPYFFSTSIEASLPFSMKKGDVDGVFISSETETQFIKSSGAYFSPWQDSFSIYTGMRSFGFEIGYQHKCVHPILVLEESHSNYYSGFDKIYCKVSGSF